MEAAVHELQGLITARFPQAAFVVEEGFDPKGSPRIVRVSGPGVPMGGGSGLKEAWGTRCERS
jgi:hypothetical protein